MSRIPAILFILITALILLAHPVIASDKLPVFVSIVPQKFFLEQIGKDLVEIRIMVQPGASPATYEPKPKQMKDLMTTKLYFAIGVPFENAWLSKIAATNPQMKIVHTDQGIEKLPMVSHHHHEDGDEDHGAEETEHSDAGHSSEPHSDVTELDPHIWLSPSLVKIQARTILNALVEADPVHRSIYENNFREFVGRIDQLDTDLKKTFSGARGLKFMVFHPAWGYFAHDYGLTMLPVEIEGKDPKPAQLMELIRHAREEGIRVVFVQPQFSSKSAEMVAGEIGGKVAVADPLAEAWIENLRTVADSFKAALK
jgi:zinc transport system substrate-binding protein